jgi:hypothetical protein
MLLLRSSSSVFEAGEHGAGALDDFAALDECDSAGYSRQTPTSVSVTHNASVCRMLCDDLAFGPISGGSGTVGGLLLILDTGDPATDVPIALLDQVEAASVVFPYQPIGKTLEVDLTGGILLEL